MFFFGFLSPATEMIDTDWRSHLWTHHRTRIGNFFTDAVQDMHKTESWEMFGTKDFLDFVVRLPKPWKNYVDK